MKLNSFKPMDSAHLRHHKKVITDKKRTKEPVKPHSTYTFDSILDDPVVESEDPNAISLATKWMIVVILLVVHRFLEPFITTPILCTCIPVLSLIVALASEKGRQKIRLYHLFAILLMIIQIAFFWTADYKVGGYTRKFDGLRPILHIYCLVFAFGLNTFIPCNSYEMQTLVIHLALCATYHFECFSFIIAKAERMLLNVSFSKFVATCCVPIAVLITDGIYIELISTSLFSPTQA